MSTLTRSFAVAHLEVVGAARVRPVLDARPDVSHDGAVPLDTDLAAAAAAVVVLGLVY